MGWWQGLPGPDTGLLFSPQAELPFRAGDVITVFGGMDDDGFYYVRTPHQPLKGLTQNWEGDEQGFLRDAWRCGQVTSHDRDVDPRLFLQGLPGQGGGAEAPLLLSGSPLPPLQGELNGRRGLVPSNFLEGPGPEASSLNKEPGTPRAESQVSEELGSQPSSWVSALPVCWWGRAGGVGGGGRAQGLVGAGAGDAGEPGAQAGAAE